MKRIVLSIIVGLSTAFSAVAGNWHALSLLTVPYLEVTNTIGVTNLSLIGGITTNVPGVIFTNLNNVLTNTAASTGVSNYVSHSFFQDISSWEDLYGPLVVSSNGLAAQSVVGLSGVSVYVLLKGGSGANTATSFVLVPILDGSQTDSSQPGFESNQAGDAFTFAVTPNTTTFVSMRTNLPTYGAWRGIKGIRVKSITAGDTDASSQVGIYKLEVTGYVP